MLFVLNRLDHEPREDDGDDNEGATGWDVGEEKGWGQMGERE